MTLGVQALTLDELQIQQHEWAEYNFPNGKATHTTSLLGIFEEAGELAHAHLKGLQGIRHTPEEILDMKEDALADILIYMVDYATRNNISMQNAIDRVWPAVRQRDWIRFPTNGKDT